MWIKNDQIEWGGVGVGHKYAKKIELSLVMVKNVQKARDKH